MNVSEFRKRLSLGGTVPLSAAEWRELAQDFPVEERHQTQLAGELLIVRVGEGLAAVEAPLIKIGCAAVPAPSITSQLST